MLTEKWMFSGLDAWRHRLPRFDVGVPPLCCFSMARHVASPRPETPTLIPVDVSARNEDRMSSLEVAAPHEGVPVVVMSVRHGSSVLGAWVQHAVRVVRRPIGRARTAVDI